MLSLPFTLDIWHLLLSTGRHRSVLEAWLGVSYYSGCNSRFRTSVPVNK